MSKDFAVSNGVTVVGWDWRGPDGSGRDYAAVFPSEDGQSINISQLTESLQKISLIRPKAARNIAMALMGAADAVEKTAPIRTASSVCRDAPFANVESGPRNDGNGASFMGMIPRSSEPADKLAALEAQSGAMTALSVAISRRLDACLSNPQAWESQMWTISECGAHLPSARWARLALIIEKCMPHLQEELRELEALVSQNTGLRETEK